jgi:hypothetical protein
VELSDIVARGKPSGFDLPSRQPWPMAAPFGRYDLVERIPAGADDECYWTRLRGPSGFEQIVFLRRFAEGRLDDRMMDALKRQARVVMRGVLQVFEVGRQDGWGYVVSEIAAGASIAALANTKTRIPWLVALALVFDACSRMSLVQQRYASDDIDLAITPARIMLTTHGEIALSMGLPPLERVPWHRKLCNVIHPILALAAEPTEQAMLRALFTDDNPDAVWVASDALVEQHPELDPVLPMVFLSLAGKVSRPVAHAALVERVPVEDLRALWNLVVDVAARRC